MVGHQGEGTESVISITTVNPNVKNAFKADDANILFEQLLSEFVIKDDVKVLYKELLDETFSGEQKNRTLCLRQIKTEIDKLSVRIESIEDKFFDDLIEASTYNAMKRKTQTKINDLKAEKVNLKNLYKGIEEYLKLGISFLHGIDKLNKNSPANIKKRLLVRYSLKNSFFENKLSNGLFR